MLIYWQNGINLAREACGPASDFLTRVNKIEKLVPNFEERVVFSFSPVPAAHHHVALIRRGSGGGRLSSSPASQRPEIICLIARSKRDFFDTSFLT
jgi:hypothetical protein